MLALATLNFVEVQCSTALMPLLKSQSNLSWSIFIFYNVGYLPARCSGWDFRIQIKSFRFYWIAQKSAGLCKCGTVQSCSERPFGSTYASLTHIVSSDGGGKRRNYQIKPQPHLLEVFIHSPCSDIALLVATTTSLPSTVAAMIHMPLVKRGFI